MFVVTILSHSGRLYDEHKFETRLEAENYAEEVEMGQHAPTANNVKSVEVWELIAK